MSACLPACLCVYLQHSAHPLEAVLLCRVRSLLRHHHHPLIVENRDGEHGDPGAQHTVTHRYIYCMLSDVYIHRHTYRYIYILYTIRYIHTPSHTQVNILYTIRYIHTPSYIEIYIYTYMLPDIYIYHPIDREIYVYYYYMYRRTYTIIYIEI